MIRRSDSGETHTHATARRGAVLLEAMVALAIVGIAGMAWMTALVQSLHTTQQARSREAEIRSAAAVLDRTAVWSPSDLLAHVGRSRAGSFDVVVSEVSPLLFDVAVTDTVRGTILLRTSVYATDRPDTAR